MQGPASCLGWGRGSPPPFILHPWYLSPGHFRESPAGHSDRHCFLLISKQVPPGGFPSSEPVALLLAVNAPPSWEPRSTSHPRGSRLDRQQRSSAKSSTLFSVSVWYTFSL